MHSAIKVAGTGIEIGASAVLHQSITRAIQRRDASYLRSRIGRVYAHRRLQVLDDLLGESFSGSRKVKMSSWENAGPKLTAGELSPRPEGVRMRDVVGAAKCGDRTNNAIPWNNCIPFHEREIGS